MDGNMILFNGNWTFLKTNLRATMGELEYQRTRFKPVELPHDWLIYDAKNLYEDSCGWYQKEFVLLTGEIQDLGPGMEKEGESARKAGLEEVVARTARGEKLILRFDGVYMDSTVYVNGQKIGDWKYGYSTFDLDITGAVKPGKNRILVQVRHHSPNSRWYSGAGIYRNVWLKVCPVVYLPLDGTYVHTEVIDGDDTAKDYRLHAETEISARVDINIGCRYRLLNQGEPVVDFGWYPAHENRFVFMDEVVKMPRIWDIDNPNCYELQVLLCRKDREDVMDEQRITIGFRDITFSSEEGLFLNGRHVKIHGVCEHHDLGCLGAAFHKPAMKRKIDMLKKMGVNAIRTSHNMPAPELMELADENGILILSEAFDMWERPKTEYDYARFFKDWCEKDVASWVRRDRNHPSLLMWSIGNEIYDTHADEHGVEITKRLFAAVRHHDPRANAPVSIGSNYMPWQGAQNCADVLKTAGYNYGEACYEEHHKAHPDWVMYGSETASLVQSRGIYHFPMSQSVLAEEDLQCSCLGNSTTSWGARSWEKCITDDRDANYIWGQFIWTGFDYIGEPTPYHTKNSYFGQIDTAGFPKDSYYVFQAEWTDYKTAPMVHVFPYWDFNRGQLVDIRVCSNAPCVELFVNGESCGKQEIDHANGLKLVKDWQVPYIPGSVVAVAYDENGKELAREERTSFDDASKIALTADKTEMTADGEDLCFVTISALDASGNIVENAADYVKVSIGGPGRILGMDNGDSTDYDDYKTTVRKLFSGKLLVVVGSTYESGDIILHVESNSLEREQLHIHSKAPKKGITDRHYLEDCARDRAAELPDRIPVRKIRLTADGGTRLTPEKPELIIEAALLPANTTDAGIKWSVVNAAGIEVNCIALDSYEEDGRYFAKLTAKGDGAFYIRATVCDGEKALVLSQLEASVEGFGPAYLDPYQFVSAGLYTDVIGEVGNGNEKGISTAREGKSGATYGNLDFGEFGSDTLTLSVFALNDEPCELELWVRTPKDSAARKLDTLIYQKPSIWNVYQEETYRLPERLYGNTQITLILKQKIHLKGFVFEGQEKAYSRLTGAQANAVYGDSFRKAGDMVREIGNNVTICYDNMDFGAEGAGAVTVWGQTPLAGNTIHIVYTEEGATPVKRMIEFKGTGDGKITAQTFKIEKLSGKGKIEIVFLPGSCFDLEAVQFSR